MIEQEPPVDDQADTSRLINQVETLGTTPAAVDWIFTWGTRTAVGMVAIMAIGVITKAIAVLFLFGWKLL